MDSLEEQNDDFKWTFFAEWCGGSYEPRTHFLPTQTHHRPDANDNHHVPKDRARTHRRIVKGFVCQSSTFQGDNAGSFLLDVIKLHTGAVAFLHTNDVCFDCFHSIPPLIIKNHPLPYENF